ncbi:hypothetical protein ABFU82_12215 [Nocardioides sp. WV_118_6]
MSAPARTLGRSLAALLLAAGAGVLALPGTADAAPATTQAQGRVVARTGLVERTAPSSHAATTGRSHRRGAVLTLECKLNGTAVDGNGRWYKIRGRDGWVSARYVANIGAAPVDCTAGDWAYEVSVGTVIRQGPSRKDRRIGSLARGTEVDTRWIARRGGAVAGHRGWVAVNTPSGNRGWISLTNLRKVA